MLKNCGPPCFCAACAAAAVLPVAVVSRAPGRPSAVLGVVLFFDDAVVVAPGGAYWAPVASGATGAAADRGSDIEGEAAKAAAAAAFVIGAATGLRTPPVRPAKLV